jgi:hypothetical protein
MKEGRKNMKSYYTHMNLPDGPSGHGALAEGHGSVQKCEDADAGPLQHSLISQ